MCKSFIYHTHYLHTKFNLWLKLSKERIYVATWKDNWAGNMNLQCKINRLDRQLSMNINIKMMDLLVSLKDHCTLNQRIGQAIKNTTKNLIFFCTNNLKNNTVHKREQGKFDQGGFRRQVSRKCSSPKKCPNPGPNKS